MFLTHIPTKDTRKPARGRIVDRLTRRTTHYLGSEYPIVAGAMSRVSGTRLVSAVGVAGGFGVLAGGGRAPQWIADEIRRTVTTGASFGVNLVTVDPAFDHQREATIDAGVTHVVLGGGIPTKEQMRPFLDAGVRVMCFAPSIAVGRRLLSQGASALVVEGSEAGGHVGPVSTSILVQEMAPLAREGAIVIAAGGIATGETVAGHLAAGMGGCQLGTRFLCSTESEVHPDTKRVYVAASSRKATVTRSDHPRIRTIPVRAIDNGATEGFRDLVRDLGIRVDGGAISSSEATTMAEVYWSGRLGMAMIDGDTTQGSLMAGQSVGLVEREEPVTDIVGDLMDRAEAALRRIGAIS